MVKNLTGIYPFYCLRNNSKSSESNGSRRSSEKAVLESEIPQTVLESLFSMPTPKAAEQEPNKMNWKNIVKKMTSLGQGFNYGEIEQQHLHGNLINIFNGYILSKYF